jgi:hypothetical protein
MLQLVLKEMPPYLKLHVHQLHELVQALQLQELPKLGLVLLQVAQALLELLSLCEQLVVQLVLQVVQLAPQLLVQAQRVLPPSSRYSVELQALELGEFRLEEQPLQWQPADCSGNR